MPSSEHLHDRIARATSRLAQLQARELLASQRQAVRERAAAKRHEARRRRELAELVWLAGAQDLPDGELVGVLLAYLERADEGGYREQARRRGDAFLLERVSVSPTRH